MIHKNMNHDPISDHPDSDSDFNSNHLEIRISFSDRVRTLNESLNSDSDLQKNSDHFRIIIIIRFRLSTLVGTHNYC